MSDHASPDVSGTVGAIVRRVQPCMARRGAYKTRTWRTRHFWSGTDHCVWCGKTKAEVGAAPNATGEAALPGKEKSK